MTITKSNVTAQNASPFNYILNNQKAIERRAIAYKLGLVVSPTWNNAHRRIDCQLLIVFHDNRGKGQD